MEHLHLIKREKTPYIQIKGLAISEDQDIRNYMKIIEGLRSKNQKQQPLEDQEDHKRGTLLQISKQNSQSQNCSEINFEDCQINPYNLLMENRNQFTDLAMQNLGIEKENLDIVIRMKDFYNIKQSPYLHMQRFVSRVRQFDYILQKVREEENRLSLTLNRSLSPSSFRTAPNFHQIQNQQMDIIQQNIKLLKQNKQLASTAKDITFGSLQQKQEKKFQMDLVIQSKTQLPLQNDSSVAKLKRPIFSPQSPASHNSNNGSPSQIQNLFHQESQIMTDINIHSKAQHLDSLMNLNPLSSTLILNDKEKHPNNNDKKEDIDKIKQIHYSFQNSSSPKSPFKTKAQFYSFQQIARTKKLMAETQMRVVKLENFQTELIQRANSVQLIDQQKGMRQREEFLQTEARLREISEERQRQQMDYMEQVYSKVIENQKKLEEFQRQQSLERTFYRTGSPGSLTQYLSQKERIYQQQYDAKLNNFFDQTLTHLDIIKEQTQKKEQQIRQQKELLDNKIKIANERKNTYNNLLQSHLFHVADQTYDRAKLSQQKKLLKSFLYTSARSLEKDSGKIDQDPKKNTTLLNKTSMDFYQNQNLSNSNLLIRNERLSNRSQLSNDQGMDDTPPKNHEFDKAHTGSKVL